MDWTERPQDRWDISTGHVHGMVAIQKWRCSAKILSNMSIFYNVQMDAAVLGDRLPEGIQKPLLSHAARKCLQG